LQDDLRYGQRMRILITGGTGFIGSRLALRCLERGHRVRLLGQENTEAETENAREAAGAGAEVVLGSILDAPVVRDAVSGNDVVFHLAAAQHEANVPDAHFHAVNVEGTHNLLDATLAAGVRRFVHGSTIGVLEAAGKVGVERFVHGSTIGVYGEQEGVLDEDSPRRPDNIYGVTKGEAEERVLAFRSRLPVVVIRIPEVYGPGDRRLVKLFRAIDRGVFFMIGRGENLHHPIYIDDLNDGLLAAARSPAAVGQVFLLAGREAVATREMVDAIAEAVGASRPRVSLPLPLFDVVATLMEVTLRPLGVQPPLHRRRLDFFRKSFRLDAAKAREEIGFTPRIGFTEGARRTAAWYRERGYV